MLIPFILVAVVVASIVWQKYDPYADAPVIITIFASILLGVVSLTVPIGHLDGRSKIAAFQSVQATLDAARVRGESIENAALQVKVIEANQWLASAQFYNKTVFDIWTPDAVEALRPIR